jgi:hypothetical protein
MSTTAIHPATKYRVAIRDIAIKHGWTWTQESASTDRFVKADMAIDVHHGPSNLISYAEVATAKGLDEIKGGQKMFRVQALLTGVADPKHENFIRLSRDQVLKYESGQGIAKIAAIVVETSAPAEKATPQPAKAVQKPSSPSAKVAPSPKPKPAARTPKVAPANA